MRTLKINSGAFKKFGTCRHILHPDTAHLGQVTDSDCFYREIMEEPSHTAEAFLNPPIVLLPQHTYATDCHKVVLEINEKIQLEF